MPDYTKQRESKQIQICPKCGQKGRVTEMTTKSKTKGVIESQMFTHRSKTIVIAGIPFNEVTEWCYVSKTQSREN